MANELMWMTQASRAIANIATPVEAKTVAFPIVEQLPSIPAVYWVFSDESLFYVGASVNLQKRWRQHHRQSHLEEVKANRLAWIGVREEYLRGAEQTLIRILSPLLNSSAVPTKQILMTMAEYELARDEAIATQFDGHPEFLESWLKYLRKQVQQ